MQCIDASRKSPNCPGIRFLSVDVRQSHCHRQLQLPGLRESGSKTANGYSSMINLFTYVAKNKDEHKKKKMSQIVSEYD